MICYKLHQPFSLVGFEDLDVVTQSLIKEVIKQGISMDSLSDLNNFTSLNKNKHEAFIDFTAGSADPDGLQERKVCPVADGQVGHRHGHGHHGPGWR